MSRDLIAELAGGPVTAWNPRRDVTLLFRAAWLLSQHPDYARPSPLGMALRRVRIDLLALAGRLDEEEP